MESDKIIIFPLNLDAMLRACVRGGSSCNPQKVCDAIREWTAAHANNCTIDELRNRIRPGEKLIWRYQPSWFDDGQKCSYKYESHWHDEGGPLPNHSKQADVASLATEFGYTVVLDVGCAAIILDPKTSTVPHDARKEGQPRLFAKGVEAIHGAVSSEPPTADIPADWVAFVRMCTKQAGKMISGNELSMRAKSLRDAAASAPIPEGGRPGHREALAIQMLVDGGFVTAAKANEALQIAFGDLAGPLKPAANRSWWKDVKPETDLAVANDVIGCMLEDWQKVGEALGFKDFADPESIIGLCKELFDESPKPDAAEALALLDGVINKLKFDDEHGLETDLRSLRRILTAGVSPAQLGEPPADEFADIREFRRREAEMDRQDAERAAAEHDQYLKGFFPRSTPEPSFRTKVVGEFDGIATDIPMPESPAPMEPEWKRDEEKTMLRILLLSADTTGFHGNDPTVHIARIAKWTDDECRAVDDWCVAMHLHAGDRGVRVPPKPDVLVSERPEAADSDTLTVIAQARGPISAKELERAVVSIIVAETRYPEHHFSHAAKRIAELLTRGSAE